MQRREELLNLRKSTEMNRKQFAEYFGIPYRTVTDWELGNRQMPEYLLRLMTYKTQLEALRKDGAVQTENYKIENIGGMELTFKRAIASDIDELVKTRIEVLRAANKLDEYVDMTEVQASSKEYYMNALKEGTHIAYLVYHNDQFVGAGGMSFFQVMPTYHNPSGNKAYIMNMYTKPEYRRKGIAYRTLDLLVNEAKDKGITNISLEATYAGRPLYEKYGFVKMNDEMELP